MLAGLGQSRTWTSADGSKTFEGDFISANDTTVTVKRGIKQMTFKLSLLSEEDQKWAKAENQRIATAAANQIAAEEFSKSKFGKAFRKLQKFDDTKFAKHQLEEAPKYFLLYFAAST